MKVSEREERYSTLPEAEKWPNSLQKQTLHGKIFSSSLEPTSTRKQVCFS